MKTIVCAECGKSFTLQAKSRYSAHNVKYCGQKCRQKVAKRRNDKYRAEGKWVREAYIIFLRDEFRCFYCGRTSYGDNVRLHIDHIVPISSGGESIASNLVTACEKCNGSKGDSIISGVLIENLKNEVEIRNAANDIRNDQEVNLSALHQIA